jgi:hypothetical protein
VYERNAKTMGMFTKAFHPIPIRRKGLLRIGFRVVNGRIRGSIDDHRRLIMKKDFPNRVGFAQIDFRTTFAHHIKPGCTEASV